VDQAPKTRRAERIVAVGLLTQREVNLLGAQFDRLWPVEQAPEFDELLRAIDDADEALQREELLPDQPA
jgi:hypothetical protein